VPLPASETSSAREKAKLKVLIKQIDEATTLHEASLLHTKKRKISEQTEEASTDIESAVEEERPILWLT